MVAVPSSDASMVRLRAAAKQHEAARNSAATSVVSGECNRCQEARWSTGLCNRCFNASHYLKCRETKHFQDTVENTAIPEAAEAIDDIKSELTLIKRGIRRANSF